MNADVVHRICLFLSPFDYLHCGCRIKRVCRLWQRIGDWMFDPFAIDIHHCVEKVVKNQNERAVNWLLQNTRIGLTHPNIFLFCALEYLDEPFALSFYKYLCNEPRIHPEEDFFLRAFYREKWNFLLMMIKKKDIRLKRKKDSLLQKAIENGYIQIVEAIIAWTRQPWKQPFFLYAVESETKHQKEIIQCLLQEKRISPRKGERNIMNILIGKNLFSILELFLWDGRICVHSQNLKYAIEKERKEIFDRLLAYKHTRVHTNVLFRAVDLDAWIFVKRLLLDKRIRPNWKMVILAIRNESPEMAKLLLAQPTVDPSKNQQQCLFVAIQREEEKIVKYLLKHPKVDPTINNYAPLREAFTRTSTKIVHMLLRDRRLAPKNCECIQIARAIPDRIKDQITANWIQSQSR